MAASRRRPSRPPSRSTTRSPRRRPVPTGALLEEAMQVDQDQVRDFARTYIEAWCNHDPAGVADHYTPGGTIAINGGEPTEITEVARSFMSAFPDIQVFVDDVLFKEGAVELHWTFTGTNTGPGGTGKSVRISGFEAWRFGD